MTFTSNPDSPFSMKTSNSSLTNATPEHRLLHEINERVVIGGSDLSLPAKITLWHDDWAWICRKADEDGATIDEVCAEFIELGIEAFRQRRMDEMHRQLTRGESRKAGAR